MEKEEMKALQEVAKLGTKALDSGDKLGGFLSRLFGTTLQDTVGVVGGDWLHHIRIRNAAKLAQRTEEILRDRGIVEQTIPMSPSVALPLLHAAQDETRQELQEMWARMLANGMDPTRRYSVRQSIISAVKSLDPPDAVVLQKAFDVSSSEQKSSDFSGFAEALGITNDELQLSISNLSRLGCISGTSSRHVEGVEIIDSVSLTVLGREILRACSL